VDGKGSEVGTVDCDSKGTVLLLMSGWKQWSMMAREGKQAKEIFEGDAPSCKLGKLDHCWQQRQK
jgi:hypothetical protein